MLKNISIYSLSALAISTNLMISPLTAMQDEKDSFFNYSKIFQKQSKEEKNKEQINQKHTSSKVNYKQYYNNSNVINVSNLSDQEIIKVAYIAANFSAKYNDPFVKLCDENRDDILNNPTASWVFLERLKMNTKGIQSKELEKLYSSEERMINIDYYNGYRIKFAMSKNTIHPHAFNADNAKGYPLLQIIVRNLVGNQDSLVRNARTIFESLVQSKIKSNTSQEYSEEDAIYMWKLEKKIYDQPL